MGKYNDPVCRRDKEIRTQIALGTLDVNKLSGKDFLAIEDTKLMEAIKPIWIKERSLCNGYEGQKGWDQIMLGHCLRFGMSRRDRNIEILRQEEVSRLHAEKKDIGNE